MTVRRRTTGKYRSSSSLFGALLRRAAFPESKEGKHACFSLPTQYLSDPGPSGLHRELGLIHRWIRPASLKRFGFSSAHPSSEMSH